MNGDLKKAFDDIHADKELKDRTMEYISRRTEGYGKAAPPYRRILAASACLVFLLFGAVGCGVYFTAVSVISIDINPSFEMGINRFDKVVSLEGYNDDGDRLAESINVRFMDYREAVDKIINDESISDYISRGEIMSIAVAGFDEKQSVKMLSDMENCASGHKNTYCYSAEHTELAQAHDAGLSYGKYMAYLQIKELYPDITEEDIKGMTMRELHDMLEHGQTDGADGQGDGSEHRHGHGGSGRHH